MDRNRHHADSHADTRGLMLQRLLAIAAAALVLWLALSVPSHPEVLLGVCAACLLIHLYKPTAWLIYLPPLLATVDLTPWSGRLLFNELDIVALCAVAGCLWHGLYGARTQKPLRRSTAIVLIALLVAHAVATARGLMIANAGDAQSSLIYLDSWNAIRIERGFFWAVLLIPPLRAHLAHGQRSGTSLVIGMQAGLAAAAASVLLERLLFLERLDPGFGYRVTGMFGGMHTGGASLDAYLVLTMPFFAIAFYAARSRLAHLLGGALLAGGCYALLVTFSLVSHAALASMLLILFLRDQLLRGRWRSESGRAGNVRRAVIATCLAGALAIPLLGVLGSGPLVAALHHIGDRIEHWRQALHLADGAGDQILGHGRGTFPRSYRARTDAGRSMARIDLVTPDGAPFVRLSPSDERGDLHIRQRFAASEPGPYRVMLRLRSRDDGKHRLLIEFCERNVFKPATDCPWLEVALRTDRAGEWFDYELVFTDEQIARDRAWIDRPVDIALLNRGLDATLDVGRVQIQTASGRALLRNPDFTSGLDHWLIGSPRGEAWHVGNIWVSALFDGGLLELGALALLMVVLLARLVPRTTRGSPLGAVMLCSVIGFLIIGVFDSSFDEPRISLLFYLVAWCALLQVPSPPHRDGGSVPWLMLALLLVCATLVVAAAGTAYLMHQHDASMRHVARKGVEHVGLKWDWLDEALQPPPRFSEWAMDGRVRPSHPRILMPELASWSGVTPAPPIVARERALSARGVETGEPCARRDPVSLAACYLRSGAALDAQRLARALLDFELRQPMPNDNAENHWELALGYDLLARYPDLDASTRATLEARLHDAAVEILDLLDRGETALWHNGSSLAANAWLCAIVLSPERPGVAALQTRAQGYLLDAFSALLVSEAWPGGYNYWINSRAMPLALAGAAYLNGLDDTRHAARVRQALSRAAYWTLYATRPDHRIEGLGDEGPRVDLKDETGRVIDVIAQLTRDPIIAGYAAYVRGRHGPAAYYRHYRGQVLIFADTDITAAGDGTLRSLGVRLPPARLFGREAMNLLYIHSGWDAQETFVSFRAGHSLAHHGHYDAGHFSVFKGAPLAINSSTYGNFWAPHRLNYAIRSVAKNTMLVLRPGERVQPERHFKDNVADGGQRLTLPTGSNIDTLERWYENLTAGKRLEGGYLAAFESTDEYTYAEADITRAYNNAAHDEAGQGGKVASARRSILYLRPEDRLIVHDDVVSTKPEFVKKWLLHTVNRPQVDRLEVLIGSPDNGILESTSPTAFIRNEPGALRVDRLFPSVAVTRVVGGPDYRFYVEADGDDSVLDGQNFAAGASGRGWFDQGDWRIEIQPADAARQHRFLVALSPSIGAPRDDGMTPIEIVDGKALAAMSDRSAVIYVQDRGEGRITLRSEQWPARIYLIGLPASVSVTLEGAGTYVQRNADSAVRVLESAAPGQGALELTWRQRERRD